MSISPGATIRPRASMISSAERGAERPRAAIRPSAIITSVTSSISCEGSITRPPRIRMVVLIPLLSVFCVGESDRSECVFAGRAVSY